MIHGQYSIKSFLFLMKLILSFS
jgi:hypothetical protein